MRSPSLPTLPPAMRRRLRPLGWLLAAALTLVAATAVLAAIALAVAAPNLPEIDSLADYRPRLPLRVYAADGVLLGEYGEERRRYTPLADVPPLLQQAVLAAEDARFYRHGGIDTIGVLRAGLANFGHLRSQGASTITMQVARNFYLPTHKTFTRKMYEVLLALKIERQLGKDRILEVYMNQIYLGQRAYGFAAASEIYFGKPMDRLNLAEIAMLAGLPQSPVHGNPIANPRRAVARQHHVLNRLLQEGAITPAQLAAAEQQPLSYRAAATTPVHAEYAAELARQLVVEQYGDEAYERGLNVYLTIDSTEQQAAYRALRKGILDHVRRQPYRGPEDYVLLPADPRELDSAVAEALADHPDNDELRAAVVLQASPQQLVAQLQDGETLTLGPASFGLAAASLSGRADAQKPIRRGAVIRLVRDDKGLWQLTQLPEVEGAFVSLDPQDGAIRALVGGFDFAKNPFNHVLQSWRQPGSALKPFLYSAALEHGFTVSTVVNDSPLSLPGAEADDDPWQPVNADGRFDGPMALHTALAKSKNIVSIRLLQAIGPSIVQQWLGRFGFDPARQPANLTLALGTGAVTPLQMASAYAVFANGGLRVAPQLIRRLTDADGRVLNEPPPMAPEDERRAIDPRNAFVMGRLLQEVTASGTAARAQQVLRRPDLYGKTGTTSDTQDAWFAGYQPSRVAVAWLGYDRPRSLGERETGAALALPVWIAYMAQALQDVPVATPAPVDGLVELNGQWYFEETTPANGIQALGVDPTALQDADDEHKSILDLFKH